MDEERELTSEEIHAVSVRAVNQLIAEAEGGRLVNSKELAEVIAGCIRYSSQNKLRNLQWLRG